MADAAVAQSLLSELPANIGSALALVPALEWAKRNAVLKWVNVRTAPAISVVAAACIAAGIHQTFSYHDGTLSWVVTGLTPLSLVQAAFETGRQWLSQHWSYKAYQGFDTLKSVAVALNTLANVPTASVTGAEGPTSQVLVKE